MNQKPLSFIDKDTKYFMTITLNPSIDYGLMVREFNIFAKNQIEKSWHFIGGKGINTALVLGILGHPVISFTVSGKKEKDLFEDVLRNEGVIPHIISINEPTRHNYKIVEISSGKDTEFNEKGFSISRRIGEQIKNEIEKLLTRCNFLAISGSLPLGIKSGFYGELIHKANQQNIITAVDTSEPELTQSINAKPVILRLNKKEIEEYQGKTLDNLEEIGAMAQQICRRGIQWVIVSLGADGALGTDKTDAWYVSPPMVSVTNPIGSGDAMLAGLLSSYSRSLTLSESLIFSTSLATTRVIKPNITDLDLKTMEDIRKKTSLKKII
jgi:1-phosphofructokinase family hexose kinase